MISDTQPSAIGPLDFHFCRRCPPGGRNFDKVRDLNRWKWHGRAIQGGAPRLERMRRQAPLGGDLQECGHGGYAGFAAIGQSGGLSA